MTQHSGQEQTWGAEWFRPGNLDEADAEPVSRSVPIKRRSTFHQTVLVVRDVLVTVLLLFILVLAMIALVGMTKAHSGATELDRSTLNQEMCIRTGIESYCDGTSS